MTRHEQLTISAPPREAEASTTEHAEARHPHPAPLAGLTVGHADDPAEVAAETRATSVLSRLRRFGGAPRSGGARPSAAPAEVGRSGGAVEAGRGHQISSRLGRGAPLSEAVRQRMEAGFGTSLGHVRVHDDPSAAQHSSALGAKAFTVGNDVFLGAGVDPGDAHGEHVLAHEIAHVLDEGGARATAVRRAPEDGDDADGGAPAELTAAEIVAAAAGGGGGRNFGIGSATRARSDEAGLLWTGLAASPGGNQWVSADGQKRYRPPTLKPSHPDGPTTQANFESGPPAKRPHKDLWASNAHLTITD